MRKSKADFLELLASGDYYVLQKEHDRNLDDIVLKREDGLPAKIQNYPYRNQSDAHLHLPRVPGGRLPRREAGTDDLGGTVFRQAGVNASPPRKPRERAGCRFPGLPRRSLERRAF